MLILSRKVGESFIIGNDIEVKVTEIVGDKVKIGIEAPVSVKVYRKELSQTMESNRESAAHNLSKDLLKFFESIHSTKSSGDEKKDVHEKPKQK